MVGPPERKSLAHFRNCYQLDICIIIIVVIVVVGDWRNFVPLK